MRKFETKEVVVVPESCRDPGLSYPDPTPAELPVRFKGKRPPDGDRFREMVMMYSRMQAEQGNESLEEADDFDVGDDDMEFFSPYELQEMHEEGDMSDASFEEKSKRYIPRRRSPAKQVLDEKKSQQDAAGAEGAVTAEPVAGSAKA